eukprot:TRINITY_DN29376_c0_g1_i2.p1 TRINITY_DN29376_c0_g1~~TRINITY_DN29376_c0_g1_i2.p1  ORF type:complete len:777 (-),score=142.50 TRINITY_DN29376_c0_g1_i2:94-2424(-)
MVIPVDSSLSEASLSIVVDECRQLRSAGNELLKAKDFEGARRSYGTALKQLQLHSAGAAAFDAPLLRKEAAPLLGNLSVVHLALGDAAAALHAAEEACDADPDYLKAHFRQARALLELGCPAQAAQAVWLLVASGEPLSEVAAIAAEADKMFRRQVEERRQRQAAREQVRRSAASTGPEPASPSPGGAAEEVLAVACSRDRPLPALCRPQDMARLGAACRRLWDATASLPEAHLVEGLRRLEGGAGGASGNYPSGSWGSSTRRSARLDILAAGFPSSPWLAGLQSSDGDKAGASSSSSRSTSAASSRLPGSPDRRVLGTVSPDGRTVSFRAVGSSSEGGAASLLEEVVLPGSLRAVPSTLAWSDAGRYLVLSASSADAQGEDGQKPRQRHGPRNVLVFLRPGEARRSTPWGQACSAVPLCVPLPANLVPSYLAASPRDPTKLAMLAEYRGRQALFIVEAASVAHADRGPGPSAAAAAVAGAAAAKRAVTSSFVEALPPVSCRLLGSAAGIHFDWSPCGAELLVVLRGRDVLRVQAQTTAEAELEERKEERGQTAEPPGSSGHQLAATAIIAEAAGDSWALDDTPPLLHCGPSRLSFRAPQWLHDGRWLLPLTKPDHGPSLASLVVINELSGGQRCMQPGLVAARVADVTGGYAAQGSPQQTPLPANATTTSTKPLQWVDEADGCQVLCEKLAPDSNHFAAWCAKAGGSSWVAWSCKHDAMGLAAEVPAGWHEGHDAQRRPGLGSSSRRRRARFAGTSACVRLHWCLRDMDCLMAIG